MLDVNVDYLIYKNPIKVQKVCIVQDTTLSYFDKGWVKKFLFKLITVERYETQGPFKTKLEMKLALSNANK